MISDFNTLKVRQGNSHVQNLQRSLVEAHNTYSAVLDLTTVYEFQDIHSGPASALQEFSFISEFMRALISGAS